MYSRHESSQPMGVKAGWLVGLLTAIVSASYLIQACVPSQATLLPVSVGGLYGFIDPQGRLMIQPKFEWAGQFSEGRAPIRVRNRYGFIDTNGNSVIKPQFDRVAGFSEGLAAFELKERWGFVDKVGRMVIDARYDGLSSFSEGLAAFYSKKRMGYIDRRGNVVIAPKFLRAFDFSERLAVVLTDQERFAFIDHSGSTLPSEFDFADRFSEGFARVGIKRSDGTFAVELVDRKGTVVTKLSDHPIRIEVIGTFSEGLATASVKGRMGYIDVRGEIAISPQFDGGSSFHEGLAAVKVGPTWGYIDRTGRLAIPPRFESAGPFKNGIAQVTIGDGGITKSGYIDLRGQYVWSPTS